MERLVENHYSMLDYNTIMSIIYNIILGIDSLENYSYLPKEVIKRSKEDIELLEAKLAKLKRRVDFKKKEITLNKIEVDTLNSIFALEYEYKKIVYQIWKREIEMGNISVIHMCRDSDDIKYLSDVALNQDYRSISNCLLTGDMKLYGVDNCSFGIIYDFNYDAFLGACEIDAQLEGVAYNNIYQNKRSAFTVRNSDTPINSTIQTYTNNYQMTLTKTPFNVINPSGNEIEPFYAEIGLDKKYTRAIKIVYFKEKNPTIESKVNELANILGVEIEYRKEEKHKVA